MKRLVLVLSLATGVAAARNDSLNCRLKGSWPFGPYCDAVAIDPARSLAFCGSSGGVFVLDVSDPSRPAIVSSTIATPGTVNDLAYQTNRLLVATSLGFEVWDMTTPSDPAPLGRLSTRNYAASVAVAGSNAYVAIVDVDSGMYTGLSVIDVSDPGNPHEVSYLDMPSASGWSVGVTVAGNYAYFADGNSGGLHIIDVSNPQNPGEVGICDSLGDAEGVAVAGNYAFVADHSFGLRVVDVADPRNPRQVGSSPASYARDVAVAGSYAYVANGHEATLDVMDVSDPANPHRVGRGDFLGSPQCVVVAGNVACVAIAYDGLALVDVSDPTNPHAVGHHRNPGVTYGVAVSGSRAYTADAGELDPDSGGALRVVDVSAPQTPMEVGHCGLSGYALDVAIVDSLAYVGTFDGLHVVDVSNPYGPQEVGHCPYAATAFGVDVSGNYAYVGCGNPDYATGMCVVDVSDPRNPIAVGACEAPGIWWATVDVSGSYAYLANLEGGLRIIDVSNPQNPVEVAHDSVAAMAVTVRGDYAYEATDSGLCVLDVSSPLDPQRVGSCCFSMATDVVVDGDYAYLSYMTGDQYCGLRVVRVSDPRHPQEVGYYQTSGDASSVAVGGGYAYVAHQYDGLQVFEFYGAGVEESPNADRQTPSTATVVRGTLMLPRDMTEIRSGISDRVPRPVLLDALGRKVLDLVPGANDVSRLAPGVYIVRAVSREPSAVGCQKVIITE